MSDILNYTRRQELTCTEADLITYSDKILLNRELLWVKLTNGSYGIKIGDGSTTIKNLPYIINVSEVSKNVNDVTNAKIATIELYLETNNIYEDIKTIASVIDEIKTTIEEKESLIESNSIKVAEYRDTTKEYMNITEGYKNSVSTLYSNYTDYVNESTNSFNTTVDNGISKANTAIDNKVANTKIDLQSYVDNASDYANTAKSYEANIETWYNKLLQVQIAPPLSVIDTAVVLATPTLSNL